MVVPPSAPPSPSPTPIMAPTDPESHVSAPTRYQRIRHHLAQPVRGPRTVLPLLACAFVTGLLDSASFIAWSTFLSMQTGNTVFLALGASGQPTNNPLAWLKSLVSILCFILGVFAFARAMRAAPFGFSARDGRGASTTRGALAAAFAAQTLLLLVGAAIEQAGLVPVPQGLRTPVAQDPRDPHLVELVPIAVLAVQGGGQVVASRVLGFLEVPTTVVTTAYCDVFFDPLLFRARNARRDRMAASIVLLLAGGICGGWLSRSEGEMAAVLWVAAALKAGVAVSWLYFEPAGEESEEVTRVNSEQESEKD